MNTTQTLTNNIFYRILNIAVLYAIVAVFSRQAGVEGYGILSLIIVNATFFNLVSGFGADAGITYYAANNTGLQLGKILTLILIILLAQLLIFLLLEPVYNLLTGHHFVFKGATATFWWIGLLMIVSISLTEKYTALYNGHHLFVLYARYIFFSNLFILIILAGFLLYYPLHNPLSLIFLYAILYFGQSLVLMYIFHQRVQKSWQFQRVETNDFRTFFTFSGVALVANLVQFLCYRMDYWFVDYFHGGKELGWYAFASRLAQAFWLLPVMFAGVLFTQVARKKDSYNEKKMLMFMRVLFCINVIAGIGICLVLPFVLAFIFGNIYNESISPFRILLPGMILFCNTTVLAAYFAGKNMVYINLAGSAICFASILTGDLLLIPRFGMNGAALASSIGYSVSGIFSVLVYCRQTATRAGDLFFPKSDDWINLCSELNKIILNKGS